MISFIIKLFMIIIFYVNCVSTQSCGDWHQFKDIKCIKIADKENLHNFEDSEKICSQIDKTSTLITIHSAEEQDFINEFLFKTNKIADNVWIGLKYNNNRFEWKDLTDINYKNWINGSPSNKTDMNCVEMITESGQTGKWADVQCNKKNLVVCQKSVTLEISYLQKTILETREQIITIQKDFSQTKQQLIDTQKDLKQTKETLNKLSDNLFNKWIHFKLFADSDGKRKAFFIPMNEKYLKSTFDEAINTCNEYNATLVEPKTAQKQQLFEIFLGQLGLESYKMELFWINAKRDSSGKFKWISSGEELTFTNWYPNDPHSTSGYDYAYILAYVNSNNLNYFGKWRNQPKNSTNFVVCEHQIYI